MDNYHWKERLKISKIAKLESDLLKTNIDTAPQSRESLQTLVWRGAQTCPPPSVSNIFACLRRITFKFSSFTNIKALFPVVLTTFP